MALQLRHAKEHMEQCRWSVPTCRPKLMSDGTAAFEYVWMCERATTAELVTPADCARCSHWTPDSDDEVPGRLM